MGLSAYIDEPLSEFIARQKASASVPAAETDQTHRAYAASQRAEAAERRAIIAERRALPPPPKSAQQITAPAPTPPVRLTSKEVPAMSPEKLARLRAVESASARLATAKQSLEDAKHLYRAGMASDPVFATHVVAGAVNEWSRACAAYLSFKG